jgi:hypothetical protein
MTFDDTISKLKEQFEQVSYDRPVEDVYIATRTRRRVRQLSLTTAATLAVAMLVVVWAPFGGEGSAIAGWTPQPEIADAATLADAGPSCLSMLNSHPARPGTDTPEHFDTLGWSDMRGKGLLLVYPSETALGVCTFIDRGYGFGGDGSADIVYDIDPYTEAVGVHGISVYDDTEGAGVTYVLGRLAPEVDRITVTAPGWTADASHYDGNWLAWWPSVTDPTDIRVAAYDSSGAVIGSWSYSPPDS